MKRALVTGIGGQDGSHLAEQLIVDGYEVHGIIRRSSTINTGRLDHLYEDPACAPDRRLILHYGDMTDPLALVDVLKRVEPAEVYHLAAQSHVRVSFDVPCYSADVDALGTLRLLEAVRLMCPAARVYVAGSSEMFGSAPPPQSERTPFEPQSPYAAAKVFSCHVARNYRKAYGMFIAVGILFNHEGERRGETFVTRKVTRAVGRIKAGLQSKLYLGNLDAQRDWGYASEYVGAMRKMLALDEPHDLVIGTGESHTVREWVATAFAAAGLEWQQYVEIHPRYLRPAEVDHLRADPSEARRVLGWEPTVRFADLVGLMVRHDVQLAHLESR